MLVPTPPAPDLSAVSTLLLDADSTLVATEEQAYAAAAGVRRQLLHRLAATRWDGDRLREHWRGRSFRRIVCDLAAEEGVRLGEAELADWVDREERCVTARLRGCLAPDPATGQALTRIAERRLLAAVGSTSSARMDACLAAAGLDELLPAERRFSGEDSLALAASKPDPSVHLHAVLRLGVRPEETLAVESTRCGVRAAVAAELTTIGNLVHVPESERPARRAALLGAGALRVVEDWQELASLLAEAPRPQERRSRGSGRVPTPRLSPGLPTGLAARGQAVAGIAAVSPAV